MEDTLVDHSTPILSEIHVSSEDTSDVVDTLVESSTLIAAEINVQEDDQDSQETKIKSIIATFSVSSSTELLEFLAMIHQVIFGVSSFSGCLDFSSEFIQNYVCPRLILISYH